MSSGLTAFFCVLSGSSGHDHRQRPPRKHDLDSPPLPPRSLRRVIEDADKDDASGGEEMESDGEENSPVEEMDPYEGDGSSSQGDEGDLDEGDEGDEGESEGDLGEDADLPDSAYYSKAVRSRPWFPGPCFTHYALLAIDLTGPKPISMEQWDKLFSLFADPKFDLTYARYHGFEVQVCVQSVTKLCAHLVNLLATSFEIRRVSGP